MPARKKKEVDVDDTVVVNDHLEVSDEKMEAAEDTDLQTPSVEPGETRKDSINQTFDEVSESEDPSNDVTPVAREMDDERSGVVVTEVGMPDTNAEVGSIDAVRNYAGLEARIQGREPGMVSEDQVEDNYPDRKDDEE